MEAAMKKNFSEKCSYKIKINTNNESTSGIALLLLQPQAKSLQLN